MKTISRILMALSAFAFLSCLNTDEVTKNCAGKDFEQLKSQNTISDACKQAIQGLLPAPQSNVATVPPSPSAPAIQATVIPLGSGIVGGKTIVFLAGNDSLGAALAVMKFSQIKLTAVTAVAESLLDTARYAVKKLKDLAGTNVSISSVVDYSGSMSDEDISDASQIFGDLYTGLKTVSSPFESNIYLFSDTVKKISDFTTNADTLKKRVQPDPNFTRVSTSLYDAIGIGLKSLSTRPAAVKLLIVATDGEENSSKTYTQSSQLYALARQYKARVIVLGSLFADLSFMREMSDSTGGFYVYSKSMLALKSDFVNAGNMLANTAAIQLNSLPAGTKSIRITYQNKTVSITL